MTRSIILFSGDISRASAQSITLDPETVDGPTAPIRITGEGGEDITLTLPTNAPDLWEDRLDGRQGVKEVNPDVDEVELTLDGEETHQLRLTRVAVDGGTGGNEFTPIQLVDRETDNGEILADAEVEEIDTGDEEQEFEFELRRDLNGGETVAIDLDDPQAPQQVDYRDSNVETDGPGSVALSTPSNQEARITYTASGDEEAGDSIEVTISQFDTGGRAVDESPYNVVFEGSDGSTLTRQFQVES